MNITITIDAPELVGAINNLAAALGNTGLPLPTGLPAKADKPVTKKVETPAKAEEPVQEVADSDRYYRHDGTGDVLEVKKGESVEFLTSDVFDEISKAQYLKELAQEEEEAPAKEEPSISLEVVRGKLSTFTAEGKANQVKVKEALTALGVKKLTDVDPADYEQLLEQVGLTV